MENDIDFGHHMADVLYVAEDGRLDVNMDHFHKTVPQSGLSKAQRYAFPECF